MRSKITKKILSETSKETELYVRLYADIAIRIDQLLTEKGLTQKQLAEKMNKKPSEINRWLKGEHNFTLRSLAKLQHELGGRIISIPSNESTLPNADIDVVKYKLVKKIINLQDLSLLNDLLQLANQYPTSFIEPSKVAED